MWITSSADGGVATSSVLIVFNTHKQSSNLKLDAMFKKTNTRVFHPTLSTLEVGQQDLVFESALTYLGSL